MQHEKEDKIDSFDLRALSALSAVRLLDAAEPIESEDPDLPMEIVLIAKLGRGRVLGFHLRPSRRVKIRYSKKSGRDATQLQDDGLKRSLPRY